MCNIRVLECMVVMIVIATIPTNAARIGYAQLLRDALSNEAFEQVRYTR